MLKKQKKPTSPAVASIVSVLATLAVVYVPIPVECAQTLINLIVTGIMSLNLIAG